MLTLTYLPPGGWYNNNTIYVTRPRAGRCDGAGHRCLCDAAAAIVQPSWCDVPAGALNHTGVISSSRATDHLAGRAAERKKDLEEDGRIIDRELNSEVDKAGCLLTYPQVTGGADESSPALLTYPLPPPHSYSTGLPKPK